VLTESRRFISNLCEVNLNYCKWSPQNLFLIITQELWW
jgi:hypothetical protein